jgi:LmbE family N-acetylglucosaminyl deacetylase
LSSRAKRRSLPALIALLVLSGSPLRAQLAVPSAGGIAELDRTLQRLGESRRLLVIGAHPDDEDTRLLALVAQGFGAEAAYLSLSRGEGGQNLIGSELGVGLGLLRTRELEAARGEDGARQFFTRAYDFGYSRSLEETETLWLPDSILEDVVRVVRRFRPHVIVSVFSGTPRDGHGQHHMAGVMARRAFDVAGDLTAYPDLAMDEGLEAWQPMKFYQAYRLDPESIPLTLPIGGLDPRTGRSYHQIAMSSRSQHRSQDMGRLQEIGPRSTRVGLLIDRTGEGEDGLFAGVPADTNWLARFADSLRTSIAPARLPDAAAPLAHALDRARREHLPSEQRELLQRALGIAGGIVFDATASRETVVPGDSIEITLRLYNAGRSQVTVGRTTIWTPAGWEQVQIDPDGVLPPGSETVVRRTIAVPDDAVVTRPYFLREPLRGALYHWDFEDRAVRGQPFQPGLFEAGMTVYVEGENLRVEREVTYRYNDQAIGEVRRPVRVVPAIDVRVAPRVLLWTADGPDEQSFTVTLTSNTSSRLDGEVGLEFSRWADPTSQPFALTRHGQSESFTFQIRKQATTERDTVAIRAVARTASGAEYAGAVTTVAYDHIDPVSFVEPARAVIRFAPIRTPPELRIGYVRGAADRVPEALTRLGLDVDLLDEERLLRGELSAYDVIVVGSRAYETNSTLVEHNERLLGYVREGGRMLVQYQQYQFAGGDFAPYPLQIRRPHDRVTDETAPVRVLDSGHPIFQVPNRISDADWLGWPQERGLYFAGEWDARYAALLEMTDPGMPPMRGGLLVTEYGEGTYIYTGISFFRSIPAGTPGAVRLFLNLLAFGSGGQAVR